MHRIFEILPGAHPIQLIAAFFRDTVNCLVDGGLSAKQKTVLEGIVTSNFVLTSDFPTTLISA